MKTNIIVSCITILLVLSCIQILHTIKTSMSEITVNNNVMRIRIKIFTDDLSMILYQTLNKHIHHKGAEVDSTILEHLHEYVRSNFSISINNTDIPYTFKSFFIDHGSYSRIKKVCLTYEYTHKTSEAIKTLELKNTLLFDQIPEQKNVSKIVLQNKRTQTLTFKNQNNDTKKNIYY